MIAAGPMSVEEILTKFTEVSQTPQDIIKEWKEKNDRKVIGCFPMDIPEEIIHAAGVLPVVMWDSDMPITLGQAHISPYNCGIIRSVIDNNAKGGLDFLDGVIGYETCLQARHMLFILKKAGRQSYYHRIFLPGVAAGASARAFMIDNLKRLLDSLQCLSDQKVSKERLQRSIHIYNENRSLLRSLYHFRRNNPGVLKAEEVLSIVHSSMLMMKEDHSQLLRQLLQGLDETTISPDRKAKIFLSGSLCTAPPKVILNLIEEADMNIVDDDLFVGARYFCNDASEKEDPFVALTNRYLTRPIPSPERVEADTDWGDYIVRSVKQHQAAGVISLVIKYCPPHLAYYPDIDRKLKAAGIRSLMLEIEHEVISLEQVRTRLQAFREALGQ